MSLLQNRTKMTSINFCFLIGVFKLIVFYNSNYSSLARILNNQLADEKIATIKFMCALYN